VGLRFEDPRLVSSRQVEAVRSAGPSGASREGLVSAGAAPRALPGQDRRSRLSTLQPHDATFDHCRLFHR
jgi:hypothetical protein